MNWGGWNEFWAMGGYGLYVWGSYAVTLLLVLVEVYMLRARGRLAFQRLARRWRRAGSNG